MEHFQTTTKNGSPSQNETYMSTFIRYVTSSLTNAHFASVHAVDLNIGKSLGNISPFLSQAEFQLSLCLGRVSSL